jgi:hypothetical protein
MTQTRATPLPWPRTWRGDERLVRSSPFSYQCGGCSRCCRNKLIQVNPYEIARLASKLGMSTTDFIGAHLDGVYLRRKDDGNCGFLNAQGCSVHEARPLVCRLYPLGRHVSEAGEESFSHLDPHPQTIGEYGEAATVQEWISAQGAQPFIEAVDAYLSLFYRLFKVIEQFEGSEHGVQDWPDRPAALDVTAWLDIDLCLQLDREESAATIEQRMDAHILGLKRRFGLSEDA